MSGTKLTGAEARLANEFAGVFSRETVAELLRDSFDQLEATAKVRTYLELFAERFARERLAAVARSQAGVSGGPPEVLFVCVHNAGRSQMAAGLLDRRATGAVHVRSAGSAPADSINPAVVEAMAEIGVDLAREFPKPLTDEVVRAADVVVTMGCGDACPIYPGKRYVDWELADPAGKSLHEVRSIRDEIDRRVQALLSELVPSRTR
ncbi:MAG TPA: arsenate reductase ArsC [Candidatus Dormibacteraeota bacterium]|nr:arsenate reductase ArsC [Candidatus Dormibacteraeota bacterium]